MIKQVDSIDNPHQDKKYRPQVPSFKQNCLVQYILEEWKFTIRGQLKKFDHYVKYTERMVAHSDDYDMTNTPQTESYTLILYGKNTPISKCCRQLICFQFIKELRCVKVLCLEPACRTQNHVLETKMINPEMFHAIFMTANMNNFKPGSKPKRRTVPIPRDGE